MKKSIGLIVAAVLSLSAILVGCSSDKKEEKTQEKSQSEQKQEKSYQYYTADEVKDIIENNKPATIIDIQVKEEFDKHHIKGAIPTYAYPAKTEEDKAKLDTVLDKLKSTKDPIVIVCPGGAGGATRSIDYLIKKGVDAKKLYILKNGQKGWPYENLLEK